MQKKYSSLGLYGPGLSIENEKDRKILNKKAEVTKSVIQAHSK